MTFIATKLFHKAGEGSGGGGGGDQHNLGWYATESALTTAHPTAENGDWAIVGSTDTVWVWDSDTNAWKDTDQKGQVASVNGQTGTVVLTASDVGAATAAQGAKADTAVQPGDLATVATTGAYSDLSGTPTIPTVGDGTITITQGGVTKGTFTTNQSGNTTIDVDAGGGSGLPDQTGQSGKFLTTDGTDASWSDKPVVNTATGSNSLTILGTATTGYNAVNVGYSSIAASSSCAYGYNAVTTGANSAAIGNGTIAYAYSNALGDASRASAQGAIAIAGGVATAVCAYQLGTGTNSTPHSFAVGGWFNNAQHEYQLLSLDDGTIPAARHAALPAADGTYTLQLVIADGVPTLSWVAV